MLNKKYFKVYKRETKNLLGREARPAMLGRGVSDGAVVVERDVARVRMGFSTISGSSS